MLSAVKIAGRLCVLVGAALACFAVDAQAVYAQSSCGRLEATLATLDRNRDFRNFQARADQLRSVQRDLREVESSYVRDGCNADAKAGRTLNAACRALARRISQGRAEVEELSRGVETGAAIAEQREAVLQEIARFGCNDGNSRARVVDNQPDNRNIFEQLFDALGGGQDILEDDSDYFDGYAGYQTVRTLCVRTCDGYYWPVSYSTIPDYIVNDADQCQQQCPGAEVELFYHSNPGQEPEQAVSMNGLPYSSLPNALRYRREYDPSCSCKQKINYGQINLAEATGGQSRAVIQFGDLNFPLPLRDPRRPAAQVIEAAPIQPAAVAEVTFVNVPLPRRRPLAPGETPPPQAVRPAETTDPARYARFGEKTVRIVGPDTPYAPAVEAGT